VLFNFCGFGGANLIAGAIHEPLFFIQRSLGRHLATLLHVSHEAFKIDEPNRVLIAWLSEFKTFDRRMRVALALHAEIRHRAAG
jgi:hypothetical protein